MLHPQGIDDQPEVSELFTFRELALFGMIELCAHLEYSSRHQADFPRQLLRRQL
jgi:hypothetical protein